MRFFHRKKALSYDKEWVRFALRQQREDLLSLVNQVILTLEHLFQKKYRETDKIAYKKIKKLYTKVIQEDQMTEEELKELSDILTKYLELKL